MFVKKIFFTKEDTRFEYKKKVWWCTKNFKSRINKMLKLNSTTKILIILYTHLKYPIITT